MVYRLRKRFINWAENVGSHTKIVIKALLGHHRIEQQAYRSCMALLKLADKYGHVRLEKACERALTYTPSPSYKSVQTILKTGADKSIIASENKVKESDEAFDLTRGADYFGGGAND